jgi:hypothetical protein
MTDSCGIFEKKRPLHAARGTRWPWPKGRGLDTEAEGKCMRKAILHRIFLRPLSKTDLRLLFCDFAARCTDGDQRRTRLHQSLQRPDTGLKPEGMHGTSKDIEETTSFQL